MLYLVTPYHEHTARKQLLALSEPPFPCSPRKVRELRVEAIPKESQKKGHHRQNK